jgi:hypothetical protein
MKNLKDITRNQTHSLLDCSTVLQPSVPPCTPPPHLFILSLNRWQPKNIITPNKKRLQHLTDTPKPEPVSTFYLATSSTCATPVKEFSKQDWESYCYVCYNICVHLCTIIMYSYVQVVLMHLWKNREKPWLGCYTNKQYAWFKNMCLHLIITHSYSHKFETE